MRVFLFDIEGMALSLGLRLEEDGHDVRWWMPRDHTGESSMVGRGMLTKVQAWRPSMDWADLIVTTGNALYGNDLEPLFEQGYPIFGPNKRAAELELDRGKGQQIFAKYGLNTLPFHTFENFRDAINFVLESQKPWVVKPWGGADNKALSYVPHDVRDLVFTLTKWWKRDKLQGKFMLQEKVKGIEMGVGAWFGPGGWSKAIEENFEHKKLMNGDLGHNTGEQGTVLRYAQGKSKLFDMMLLPLTEYLHSIDYVGNIDINCIIEEGGKVWPLEATARLGWPAHNIHLTLVKGDRGKWMLDLLEGKDTLRVSQDVAVGVVLRHMYQVKPHHACCGFPIWGLTQGNTNNVHLLEAMFGDSPTMDGKSVEPSYVTAGSMFALTVGTGATVHEAHKYANHLAHKIKVPSDKIYRTDIGHKLEHQLPVLHKLGFARGLSYG